MRNELSVHRIYVTYYPPFITWVHKVFCCFGLQVTGGHSAYRQTHQRAVLSGDALIQEKVKGVDPPQSLTPEMIPAVRERSPPALRWEDKPHTCMTCNPSPSKQDRFSLKPGLLIYDHIVVTHYNKVPLFNRIIHLKWKILSSFANPQVVLNLEFLFFCWTQKKIFLKKVGKQTADS